MKYNDYMNCLAAKLPSTGQLEVFYDFISGETNWPDKPDLLFNLKYSTGDLAESISIQGVGQTWAMDLQYLPGLSIGRTDMPITHEGYFSGVDLIKVGGGVSYSGWSAILDISPDLCDYADEDNLSRVLLSSMGSYDANSGFFVGINQSNKLYIQYNHNSTTPAKTVNKEVNKDSIVGIAQSPNDLTVGVYDLETKALVQESLPIADLSPSDQIYLGGFLSNSNTDYTGYEGYINNFALFSTSPPREDLTSSCQCMFTTGVYETSTTSQIVSPNITGFTEETLYLTGVTGYETKYREQTDSDGDNLFGLKED